MVSQKNPWSPYAVNCKMKGREDNSCRSLHVVSHVAHIPTALDIIDARKTEQKLVRDKSVLRGYRISVVWLSPNYWQNYRGYLYGNIAFYYKWSRIVEGRQFYWAEVMAEHNPHSCRILVTTKDHSDKPELIKYDPSLGDGPWWIDVDGKHYWNGNITLEFMLEEDLPLIDVSEIGFVTHHDQWCSENRNNPAACKYLGMTDEQTRWEFLAGLCSRRLEDKLPRPLADEEHGFIDENWLDVAISEISDKIRKKKFGGSIRAGDSNAQHVTRALLDNLYHTDEAGTEFFASQYNAYKDAQACIKSMFEPYIKRFVPPDF